MEKKEETVVTLTEAGALGEKFVARIEGNIVELVVQTAETYATLRVTKSALDTFWAFAGRVLQDIHATEEENK